MYAEMGRRQCRTRLGQVDPDRAGRGHRGQRRRTVLGVLGQPGQCLGVELAELRPLGKLFGQLVVRKDAAQPERAAGAALRRQPRSVCRWATGPAPSRRAATRHSGPPPGAGLPTNPAHARRMVGRGGRDLQRLVCADRLAGRLIVGTKRHHLDRQHAGEAQFFGIEAERFVVVAIQEAATVLDEVFNAPGPGGAGRSGP